MPLLDTKHKQKSFVLTTLLLSAILIVLFYLGLTYLDPPEENGITVNFGSMDVGSGQVQPVLPLPEPNLIPAEEVPEENEPVVEEPTSKSEPATDTNPEVSAEKVLTQDQQESIRLKQQEEIRRREALEAQRKANDQRKVEEDRLRKAQEEADRLEREKQAALEAKRREQEEKKRKLDALIGGINATGQTAGGEGDNKTPGDKGRLDGNPYATSYYGSAGVGSGNTGYGLSGRSLVGRGKESQKCNEKGIVVVEIVVNRNGVVVEANPGVKGTTNSKSCLLEPAKATAMSYKWNADPKAPDRQIGFVVVNFKLGQ
jgi:colicin import membrane protein